MSAVQIPGGRLVSPFNDPFLEDGIGTLDSLALGRGRRLLGATFRRAAFFESVVVEIVLLYEQTHCCSRTLNLK